MPRRKSLLRLVCEPIAIALLLALAVRSVVRVYAVPSASMQPTLLPGDHIAVTPYRFGSAPARGDVVVFHSPLDPSSFVVKRIIATPGELISTAAGRVTIGGHMLAEPYANTAAGTIPPQIVPAGCFFVMGDNRQSSLDSRSWGVLPDRLIVGRARLVLWSHRGPAADSAMAATQVPATREEPPVHHARILLPIR